MGNAINYRENFRKTAAERMSKALRSFIEKEVPIYLTALKTDDYKLRKIVVRQFNESFPNYIFDDIYSILPHLERLRLNRIKNLNELTKFDSLPKIRLSCLPCKINDYLTLAYFDTGCSISCITLANARKLNLISLIDYNINGVAVGFGCNRQIVGFLTNLPVQIGSELLFNINFVVINQANADFILIGSDFMHKQGLKMNYLNGRLIIPEQIITEQQLDFIPNRPEERDFFFDLFKYQMLEQNRILMRNYFSASNSESSQSNEEFRNQVNNQLTNGKNDKANRNTNLYVRIQINGKQVFALIDTGADTCKISDNLALQLDILRFVDYDKRKISHGLGSIVSIGRIPPIPIKFESANESVNKQSTVLFVPFEVLKENRVNVLLLGSDFFTYYGCYLDFSTKSMDISINPPYKCRLEEERPKNMNLMNCDERSVLINHNYLENIQIDPYQLMPELDELRSKIMKKQREHQLKKKMKEYHIEFDEQKEFIKFEEKKLNNHLLSTALNKFNRKAISRLINNLNDDDISNSISELDELKEQTASFMNNDETNLINDIQKFKNQTSNHVYCNGISPEDEIESIFKINFV